MKVDYKNWVPKGILIAMAAISLLLLLFSVEFYILLDGILGITLTTITFVAFLIFGATSIKLFRTHQAFSYDGKRKLSKRIIEGNAAYAILPEGGVGLDVGCGSGALTIAYAKRNPQGKMTGLDRWGKEYASFSNLLCVQNAKAERINNIVFHKGDANKLPFADESFDAFVSNYIYHNIPGKNKQKLLLETLRVLITGGTFAIHDLMSKKATVIWMCFAKNLEKWVMKRLNFSMRQKEAL
ncbi:class I SAM-dependent methyltransferase [Propionimicrobium lymphophilum]|uniref:class I SAM-dependent methyltransferase n=1 Tax=Propionimicrobium lymphophilum TaxID=33012 RepID=UPI00288959BD|nr:class I SAM-dependent methyltransferase [Propionimicrobium lymphophilum]